MASITWKEILIDMWESYEILYHGSMLVFCTNHAKGHSINRERKILDDSHITHSRIWGQMGYKIAKKPKPTHRKNVLQRPQCQTKVPSTLCPVKTNTCKKIDVESIGTWKFTSISISVFRLINTWKMVVEGTSCSVFRITPGYWDPLPVDLFCCQSFWAHSRRVGATAIIFTWGDVWGCECASDSLCILHAFLYNPTSKCIPFAKLPYILRQKVMSLFCCPFLFIVHFYFSKYYYIQQYVVLPRKYLGTSWQIDWYGQYYKPKVNKYFHQNARANYYLEDNNRKDQVRGVLHFGVSKWPTIGPFDLLSVQNLVSKVVTRMERYYIFLIRLDLCDSSFVDLRFRAYSTFQ